MHSTIDTTHFHIPGKISVIADHEIPLIKEITPEEFARLYDIKSKVLAPSQTFDANSLFHINQATLQGRQTFWHVIVTTSICAVAVMIIICLSLRSTLRNLLTNCFVTRSNPEPGTTEQIPSYQPPEPKPRACTPDNENIQKENRIYFLHNEAGKLIVRETETQCYLRPKAAVT
jgi:hypothetical protein